MIRNFLKSIICTILLCIQGGIYVATGLLQPKKFRLVAQILRHRSLSHQPHRYNNKQPSTRMMQTPNPAQNEFSYVSNDAEQWTPLNVSVFEECMESTKRLDTDVTVATSDTSYIPRIASSTRSAQTILNEWIQEDLNGTWSTEWKTITYYDNKKSNAVDPIPLHGYLIRNAQFHSDSSPSNAHEIVEPSTYILLFPTAVGVHDLFLFYKATQIANHPSLQHCTIMIADLFSDPTGWMWDKTTNNDLYNSMREDLLRNDISNNETDDICDTEMRHASFRPMLQSRINAAFAYLYKVEVSDSVVTAALGWCFGGHCIAELARMPMSVQAMVTFHGVFRAYSYHRQWVMPLIYPGDDGVKFLICHGLQDPFVPSEDLEKALALFQYYGHTTSLLQLHANHGFTNPAQVHNDNPAFGYHPDAAKKAWHQALALLTRRIGRAVNV